jgi:hypothetical protein
MPVTQALDPGRELLEAFEHSCRVSEYVVGVLPSRLWRPEPPHSKGRSIAAIVAHIQSVRRTFAKMGGARPIPQGLDRARSTPDDARRGLQQSREVLVTLFREALTQGQPRVKGMPRRTVNIIPT